MKILLLLLAASVAHADTYYEKTTIPPTIPTATVLGNNTGSTAAPGAMTTIPSSVVPVYSGDCGNSVASSVLVCTQALLNFNVIGTLSEAVLNPPTTVFAPAEIDLTGTSNATAAPNLLWNNTTGALNYKAWNCHADSTGSNGTFSCGTQTVNAAGEHRWVTVTRGGTNPYDLSDISFGSAGTSNNTTHFLGTGIITLGSAPLTTASTITSTLATGTAPFTVASTTNVSNLNASLLGGATFSAPGAIGSGTPSTGAFTTLSATGLISPTSSSGIAGTTAADAPASGSVGQVASIHCLVGTAAAAATTVTMTIATPAVVTWSSHTFVPSASLANYTCPINFTTTGALPTGVVAGTNYYIIGSSVSGDTFQIADTAAHALAGTNSVATSGSQSGTQAAYIGNLGATATAYAGAALSLIAGDWDCSGTAEYQELTSLTTTEFLAGINTSIAATNIGSMTDIRTSSGSIGAVNYYLPSPVVQENVSATTTLYLNTKSTFSVGTQNEGGFLRCRRMR